MNLIYIGDRFYHQSKTFMSSLYTEDGRRSDWGFVNIALRNGEEVHIRQATEEEVAFYDAQLAELTRKDGAA